MLNRIISSTLIRRRLAGSSAIPSLVPKRGGHDWVYRQPTGRGPKELLIAGDVLASFMWWWIFWHLWHDYGHILGEFPYPDPSQWTDEELGIPPDDD